MNLNLYNKFMNKIKLELNKRLLHYCLKNDKNLKLYLSYKHLLN